MTSDELLPGGLSAVRIKLDGKLLAPRVHVSDVRSAGVIHVLMASSSGAMFREFSSKLFTNSAPSGSQRLLISAT